MCNTVEHVTGAATVIMGKLEEFMDGFQVSTDQLAKAMHELTEKTVDATNKNPTMTPFAQTQNIYTTIVQQQPTLNDLSEKDLVVKANAALDLMPSQKSIELERVRLS